MDKDIRTKLEETSEKNYPKVRQEMVAMLTIEERAKLYAERRFAETIIIPEEEISERQKVSIMHGHEMV